MKKHLIPLIFALMASSVFAAPVDKVVPVELGPKAFKDGDVIQIEEVRSTSPRLEQGDTVTVKGRYRLESVDSASLRFLLTQVEGNGAEETDAKQVTKAEKGWKDFETTITVKHRGVLHLTFYDDASGKPFGGVYFGTAGQLSETKDSWVAHYLPQADKPAPKD
jgi:hypothetical protein